MNDKQRVRHNIQWLLSENVVSMFLGFVVSAIVARYLGPEQNGIINYCVAISSLWAGVSNLGTASIFQKEFLQDKFSHEELMGTGMSIGIVGGFISVVGTIITGIILNVNEKSLLFLGIIATANLFKCVYIIQCYFLSRLLSSYYVKANVFLQMLLLFLRIFLVANKCRTENFVCLYLLEGFLQFVFYLFLYYRVNGIKRWRISIPVMQEVCTQGFPLILSSFAVTIYMRSDQIMLGKGMGEKELGIYSVAVTLAEAGQFVPVAIANSELTRLVSIYNVNKEKFRKEYIFLIEKMIIITMVMILGIELFAPIAISILYGEEYINSIPILRIYTFSELFVAIGMAEGPYNNINKLQKQQMYITCIAGGINIILNFILIPQFGGKGASVATIIAMTFQTIFLLRFWNCFKEMIYYLHQAIKFKETWGRIKEIIYGN